MRELADYAAVHGRRNGLAKPPPPEKLIPTIVGRPSVNIYAWLHSIGDAIRLGENLYSNII